MSSDNVYYFVSDGLIGVHCTHGVNRTGYFICRFVHIYIIEVYSVSQKTKSYCNWLI